MEELSLADIIATLRKQWRLIVGLPLLVAFLAGARTYFLVPQTWAASTAIIFERESAAGLGEAANMAYLFGTVRGSTIGARFKAILASRRVREQVAEEMKIAELLELEDPRGAAQCVAEMYETEIRSGGILSLETTWMGAPRAFAGAPDENEAPRLAADLANALIAALGEFLEGADYTRDSYKRTFLEEQLSKTEQELLEAEDALVAYATEHKVVSPSSQARAAIEALSEIRQRETGLRVDLRGARRTELAALERLDAQERMAISSISEQRNPQLDALHREILRLQREIAQQTEVEGKSLEHPDVQRLQAQLEEAQAQLADELSKEMLLGSQQFTIDPSYRQLVTTALSRALERSGLEAQLDGVRTEKERALAELGTMPSLSAQYQQFERQVKRKGDACNRLSEEYEKARIAEAAGIDRFNVLDAAIPPRRASGPSLIKSVVLTGFVVGFLAVLLAFWRQGRLNAYDEGTGQGAKGKGERPNGSQQA